nr:zinc-binding dehydrogenase [Dactylosporangium thailandense]
MTSVRAVLVDDSAAGRLAVGTTQQRSPRPDESVVRVGAISLNRGEVRQAQMAPAGERPGWDLAGTVESAAADGTGPEPGQRVVGLLRNGAWAESVNVPTTNLAVLPDSIPFESAAALPVAGLTALYALDQANGLAGRSVLVTGASGGVGSFAVQLASAGGARAVALIQHGRHLAAVQAVGADHIVVDPTGEQARPFGPYDLVLDAVGGPAFTALATMLAPHGRLVSYGMADLTPPPLDIVRLLQARASLSAFHVFEEMNRETAGVGLTRLLRLIQAERLTPMVSLQDDWNNIGRVAEQLIGRSFPGKAVLTVA